MSESFLDQCLGMASNKRFWPLLTLFYIPRVYLTLPPLVRYEKLFSTTASNFLSQTSVHSHHACSIHCFRRLDCDGFIFKNGICHLLTKEQFVSGTNDEFVYLGDRDLTCSERIAAGDWRELIPGHLTKKFGPKNFADAAAHCQSLSSHLIHLQTQELFDAYNTPYGAAEDRWVVYQ